jgi:hypothetical protein
MKLSLRFMVSSLVLSDDELPSVFGHAPVNLVQIWLVSAPGAY